MIVFTTNYVKNPNLYDFKFILNQQLKKITLTKKVNKNDDIIMQ